MKHWHHKRLQRIDDLLPEQLSEQSIQRRVARDRRINHDFLCGPIPLNWLTRAAKLSGKALAVGLALWFRRGLTKTNSVTANQSLMSWFGVSRHAKYRALKSLEQAGLVRLQPRSGKGPMVLIQDVSMDDANSGQSAPTGPSAATSELPQ